MSATVTVVLAGERSGWVVASVERPDPYHMGERLVVGDVHRISADGEPELWRAWLWPLAGGNLPVTQSCKASDAASPATLRARLQKRSDSKAWWTVPDGRCLVALEHGGRTSRCETASAVGHDVHRHYADGVEWLTEEDCQRSPDAGAVAGDG